MAFGLRNQAVKAERAPEINRRSFGHSWIYKKKRNQKSNCKYPLDHRKSKRSPEKHLLLLHSSTKASLIAHLVKNPPAMQETPVQFLSQEDPLEKGRATHSSILGLPLWLNW